MLNFAVSETFINDKKLEYTHFAENLGSAVDFQNDKWICDKLRRAPTDRPCDYTLYFAKVPEIYRDAVKYFAVISFIRGRTLSSARAYIHNLGLFFRYLLSKHGVVFLNACDDHIAVEFYRWLDETEYTDNTKTRIWATANAFFATMNGWDDNRLNNPFTITPFLECKRFDRKYIPEEIANQLDAIFKSDDIPLHLQCAYWVLRLIPSRIGEIVGMRIDCLKRYNGHYVLFIPTWKQNGGRREPILRSIHLEDTGIAGFLIELVKKQQSVAQSLQDRMPDNQKDALFTYHEVRKRGSTTYYTPLYHVLSSGGARRAFQRICEMQNVIGDDGQTYNITTHQFRHNGITDRLAAGFTAAQIAEMTGHHGSAMIMGAYAHLNLLPETIIEKQEYVLQETESRENRYVLFGGRILNMDEQLENRLLRNLRAHKVRGGICSDITGCKSDMWNCLDCEFFVPDAGQLDYYEEQALFWREKCTRFSDFPIIKGNAERNAELYERVLKNLKERNHPL